ncbi:DNA polymerase III subunit gamma/tau [Alistipes sp.]|uniref:DNA polymerase III subunit gamma/tau n=1 Tax=Alistipes sp. TaxID=1872444 RepID=UPI003AEF9610
MSDFIVSARKYRPATFSSVVGQQHITSTLKNAIERGQLAHAYLFCGPRGVGKTTCARIFAKAINCLTPEGAEACNGCESCRSFNEGRSLNIHELDAASNNSVEDIRTLIEQVRIIPQVGRFSVFIIDEVHMLSAAAFNAFLKTLEEPPAHAIFILATTEKHKIIPTILSRCQIYDFNRIRVEDAVEYLKFIASAEHIEADEESLNLIAQKADGGMRDALSMFDKAVSFCGQRLDYRNVAQTLNVLDYDTYFGLTQLLLEGNWVDALVAFDVVLSKGFSGQTFMAGLNRHMRDLLMAKRPETLRLIEMTGTLLERYRAQAQACQVEFLFRAISVLTELDGKIRQSSSQRLLVELGLMKIAGLGQKKNDTLTSSAEYPLPELTSRPAASAPATATAEPATAVPTAAAPAATVTPETAAARVKAAAAPVSAAKAKDSVAPTAQPGSGQPARSEPPAAPTAPAPPTVRPAADPDSGSAPQPATQPARPVRRPLISGTSLAALLGDADNSDEELSQGEAADEPESPEVDPDCAAKLERARDRILELIRERRPRFVPAFERMTYRDNVLAVSVPTTELRDEILRSKTGMLMRIAELAGTTGRIELEVTVNEQIAAARPIKLEDRVKYITEKNPLVAELRKALDLEVE